MSFPTGRQLVVFGTLQLVVLWAVALLLAWHWSPAGEHVVDASSESPGAGAAARGTAIEGSQEVPGTGHWAVEASDPSAAARIAAPLPGEPGRERGGVGRDGRHEPAELL